MSESTQTPWKLGKSYNCSNAIVGNHGSTIARVNMTYGDNGNAARANAAMIVKAVNAHDELVTALKYARRFLKPEDVDTMFIDAALAKAKASQ